MKKSEYTGATFVMCAHTKPFFLPPFMKSSVIKSSTSLTARSSNDQNPIAFRCHIKKENADSFG